MKNTSVKTTGIALVALGSLLAASSAFAIAPIKGSLNYKAPAKQTYAVKSGALVFNQFEDGQFEYRETYIRQADGSLKLIARHTTDDS